SMHGDRELALVSLALLVAAGCTPANVAVSAGAWVGAAAVEERGVGGFAGDTMLKLRIHDLLGQRRFSYLTDVNVAVSENRVMLT
ncbi:hypothetical protein, partial [Enterococcus faecium]